MCRLEGASGGKTQEVDGDTSGECFRFGLGRSSDSCLGLFLKANIINRSKGGLTHLKTGYQLGKMPSSNRWLESQLERSLSLQNRLPTMRRARAVSKQSLGSGQGKVRESPSAMSRV